ncbi:aminotransferase class I/II-fold pyridoxal phosphate-dependent enzyme [Streptomyces coeruleorubidus]|uniref:aminotransferase class I/II-fold pyridoxal phosphate-dependent enzyme n=1 Tax=Streptomyces coeruleorubidus TaxID=116188 RepID=UPI0037B3D1FE
MSLLSARRLMAAHIALVTVATVVYMTVPAAAPALWAAIGLSGVVAVVIGIRVMYVDDAHGFGVIGERGPGETCPYGMRGNCVVRHTGESYDGIVLVAGFSKAYSSLLAFLALPSELKNRLKTAAAPYLYSGPSPTASPATALAGLDVNERRGDVIRADLYRKRVRVLDRLEGLGVDTLNTDRLPIVDVPLANPPDLDAVAAYLGEEGIYVRLAAYPLVPRDRVGFRIQLTALSSDDDIDRLNGTLTRLSERFPLRLKG